MANKPLKAKEIINNRKAIEDRIAAAKAAVLKPLIKRTKELVQCQQ
jgi:hypothetical protein